MGVQVTRFWLGPGAVVSHFYVTPNGRRTGRVFRALVAAVEGWAREQGALYLLGTMRHDAPGRPLERMGARPMGRAFMKEL